MSLRVCHFLSDRRSNPVLFILFTFIFTSVSAAESFYIQDIYLVQKTLPKIVAKIKKENPEISKEQLKFYLKNNLIKVTPGIAKNKFNIEWKDNDIPELYLDRYMLAYKKLFNDNYLSWRKKFYPAIAICYMGTKVGYGLFAIDDIKANQIISEYTGRHITRWYAFRDSEYLFDASLEDDKGRKILHQIDAKKSGNAARFASSIFSLDGDLSIFGDKNSERFKEELLKYGDNLAVVNAAITKCDVGLRNMCGGVRAYLYATKDIKAFEQIGVYYGDNYWRKWYKRYGKKQIPCLFDKNGNVIPVSLEKNDSGWIKGFVKKILDIFILS